MPFDTNISDIRRDWAENKQLILAQNHVTDLEGVYQDKLTAAKGILKNSKTGAALLDWAEQTGIDFVLDKQLPVEAAYYSQAGIVALSKKVAETSPHSIALILAHEIRHAVQDSNGFIYGTTWQRKDGLGALLISPDDMIIGTRLTEADAYAHQLQVAAELVVAGDQQGWDPIAEVTAKGNLCVVAKRFVEVAQADHKTLETGEAMRAAFDAFMDDKVLCFTYNRDSIRDVSDRLRFFEKKASERGWTEQDNTKPDRGIDYTDNNAMRALGQTLDGKSYLKNLPDNYLDHAFFNPESGMGIMMRQQYKYVCEAYKIFCDQVAAVQKRGASKSKQMDF